jgi:hypothetical protein
LLDYAVERAADLQIVRTVAVQSEKTLGFAAVHQLLLPLLHLVDRLPEPQQRALGVAFGMVSGPPADPFLVGLAVLTLLSDAAEARPVLCVVDDAQWLDDESADILGFVARRLLADRIGLLFAIRETTEPVPRLQALPGLRIAGLPEQDASALLETSINRPSVTSSKSCSRGARGFCPRTRRRCCCWRRQTNPGKQIACGRRPPHWASRRPPWCPRRPRECWLCGRRCGSPISWSGRRSTTARQRSSGGTPRRDAHEPLFMQVKEATASVLEHYLPKSRYAQPCERVVKDNGSCRPPATSSSAGPRASPPTATTTGASFAT